jgi:oligopeptide/dipeptide ABC transporter ATP-binding protein
MTEDVNAQTKPVIGNVGDSTTRNGSLLKVEDMCLYFRAANGVVRAVEDMSFELDRGRSVAVVGESGCGKTSLARAILRLLPRNVERYTGRVFLDGTDVMSFGEERFRRDVRWVKMSMVSQSAMNSLNPVLRVGHQVAEPLLLDHRMGKREALERTREVFSIVGVPAAFLDRYAFELSGGMRQRVIIAMALVANPVLVMLDEPTSALDVLTQANIFNVLKRLKKELGVSFILITHDIATSSELADEVAVMYAGQIVEVSGAHRFFEEPLHPYSQKLMASVPRLHATIEPEFIAGQPPSLINLPKGCRFADRCPSRFEKCAEEPPEIQKDGRRVKCWLYV